MRRKRKKIFIKNWIAPEGYGNLGSCSAEENPSSNMFYLHLITIRVGQLSVLKSIPKVSV